MTVNRGACGKVIQPATLDRPDSTATRPRSNLTNSHPVLSHTRDTEFSDLFYEHTLRPRTVGITLTYRHRATTGL